MNWVHFKYIGFSFFGLAFSLLSPKLSHAQDTEVSENVIAPHFAISTGIASLTSVTAERGAYVAASFQGEYLFESVPLYLLTRFSFGDSITGNNTWRFDHYHQQLELGLGYRKQLGRGALFAQVTGGALGVYEVASHHQVLNITMYLHQAKANEIQLVCV